MTTSQEVHIWPLSDDVDDETWEVAGFLADLLGIEFDDLGRGRLKGAFIIAIREERRADGGVLFVPVSADASDRERLQVLEVGK